MKELIIKDKQKYLDENFPFYEKPKLTDKFECLHCGLIITVGDYKVYKGANGFEFICCPNAPECDGTLIDWFPLSGEKDNVDENLFQ
jgi:ssDNA-binding Zn-finger/Zn-ribbon topoisomerase 1